MEAKNFVTLGQRKDEVEITLRYLENQRHAIEENLHWVGKAAYQSRVALLDEIAGWYREELATINRIKTDTEACLSDQNG